MSEEILEILFTNFVSPLTDDEEELSVTKRRYCGYCTSKKEI